MTPTTLPDLRRRLAHPAWPGSAAARPGPGRPSSSGAPVPLDLASAMRAARVPLVRRRRAELMEALASRDPRTIQDATRLLSIAEAHLSRAELRRLDAECGYPDPKGPR